MIPSKPDLDFVLKVLYSLMRDIGAPGASRILARTMKDLIIVEREEDPITTLAIDGAEKLYINQKFWEKNIKTEDDMKFVLLHELMHHILGDTAILRKREIRKETVLDNLEGIAMDARINLLASNMLRIGGLREHLLYRMYKPEGLEGLLRPRSSMKESKLLRTLYSSIYELYDDQPKGYRDILETLRLILGQKMDKMTFVLIGGHNSRKEGEGKEEEGKKCRGEIPKEVRDEILNQMLEGAHKMAGKGETVYRYLAQLLSHRKKVNRKLLASYSTTHNINKIRSIWTSKRMSKKPIPIRPTKRDLSKIAIIGSLPVMWTAPKTRNNRREFGVAIYLDVSGSVVSHLPKILRTIVSMKREINIVHCFSNKIVDHTLSQLKEGKIDTTGGTDFNCVASHILENNYKRCVVITDGYASMAGNLSEKLSKHLHKCAVILFNKGNCDPNNWFSRRYDTFYLDEVTN